MLEELDEKLGNDLTVNLNILGWEKNKGKHRGNSFKTFRRDLYEDWVICIQLII